jgi:metal-responsive CopG/Arc/MetJ family transcriptional regulator
MYNKDMRTTIEMKAEHRARLLEMAARRGDKGFSVLVTEAIQVYLDREKERQARRRSAVAMRGTLSSKEADRLRRRVADLRENWR